MNERETKTQKRPSSGIRTLSQMYVNMCCLPLRASPLSNLPYQRCCSLIFSPSFFVRQYQTIPQEQLPEGVNNGHSFTTVCINPAIYLPWLVSQAIKAGVVIVRGEFAHICDAANAHHSGNGADLVVNCTGLSARTLGGVGDADMVPIRGQTVLVRNDTGGIMYNIDKTEKEPAYIMQRAAGKLLISSPFPKNFFLAEAF